MKTIHKISFALISLLAVPGASYSQNIGVNNPNPHPSAALDVTGTNKGMLVPRVALIATNNQAPITGAASSLLVFNTATAGTGQFVVKPGYYYWTGTEWKRLNDEKGSGSNVRTIAGTTSATATSSLALVPQMTTSFIAEDTAAVIMFSAAGANPNSCGQRSLQFVIRVNGINIAASQASIEDVTNFTSNKVWDITMIHPVQLSPGANTTIEVLWLSQGGCSPITNGPGTVAFPLGSYRTLTVIEPKGSGVFTATGPPTGIGSNWGVTGNAGTSAATNFIGTTDNNPITFKTNNTTRMTLSSVGNLGIGTASPANRFHVVSLGSSGTTAHPNASVILESNTNNYMHLLTPNPSESGILFSRPAAGSLASIIYNRSTLPKGFLIETNNATRMVIDSLGNVGIGTATPGATFVNTKLDVIGAATGQAPTIRAGGGGDVVLGAGGSLFFDDNYNYNAGNYIRPVGGPNTMGFFTAGVERFKIASNGNVGIGIATPTEKLMVAGNVDATGDLYTGPGNGVINCGGGNMNANINMIADAIVTPLNANGDEDLYISGVLELGGNGFKPGGGSWATASDARLKKDVTPYTDGLDKVIAIRPVSFKYNEKFKSLNNGKTYIGVIAQEIKEVAPYTVEPMFFGQEKTEDENGNENIVKQGEEFLSYDSSALTYMLINSVKELKALNDKQQEKIDALEKEVIRLGGK